jgi:glycosyltransferase involved in cell wall biosynthesis
MTVADGHVGVATVSSTAPLVTVIMPAYNAEKFILDAIRSILAQGYPSVEILVIDDGSKDSTVALVQREAPQARIIHQSNAGAAAARNTGLRLARGKYICFLDADDGWFPGKLSAQVDYLQKHPEVGMVYHRWFVWVPDETGSYCTPKRLEEPAFGQIDPACSGWIYTLLLLDCIVHTSTVMMRLEVVRDIGFFDTTLVTGEDYNYWLRVSRKYQIHKLTGIYSFYRAVHGSLTSQPAAENNEYNVLETACRKWGLSSPDGQNVSTKLMNKRLGKLAFDFGYGKYYQGEIRQARDSFLKALRHDPFLWRALGYLLVASLRK